MDLAQKYHSKYPKGKIVDLWTGRPDSSYPKEVDMAVKDAGGGISASGSAVSALLGADPYKIQDTFRILFC